MTACLSWGSGPVLTAGWTHSDLLTWGPEQDHIGDIRDGLPWEDGSFAYCVSHHALQQIPWGSLTFVLGELRRVTWLGGWLRLSVPDASAAFRAYDHYHPEHFKVADEHEATHDGKFCVYLSQGGSTRTLFTGPWLCELVARAGWVTPRLVAYQETVSPYPGIVELDSRPDESLFIEAHR